MDNIKVVFMGTPDFSVSVLEGLIENYDVVGVVSQPDKKIGRHQVLTNTPVKAVALEHNIKVFQPVNIKEDYEGILALNPDIIITCAYGQIIPKEILDYPRLGCVNVHASLLPKYRGGAPIHKSIINGDEKTGVTIMYMDVKMDSGDIISQEETTITDQDNLETVHDRLSIIGRDLLLKTLPSIIDGTNDRIPQDVSKVTYAYNIKREEEHIDFSMSVREVFNLIRGLSPVPGANAILDDKEMKIYASIISGNKCSGKPGEITNTYKNGIGVCCGDGEIILTDIKPFGKKRMSAASYLNGIDKSSIIGKEFK
ncbi:MAG: methionyl-tRNA formyltransferase [Firmicutes bacterium]|nr:methionyl-tRNA formyltransferase [Bacillota bacterium]